MFDSNIVVYIIIRVHSAFSLVASCVLLESLSKRRFCQHGRQPEVSCVVTDGEWWRQPFLFEIMNVKVDWLPLLISNKNGWRHHSPSITTQLTSGCRPCWQKRRLLKLSIKVHTHGWRQLMAWSNLANLFRGSSHDFCQLYYNIKQIDFIFLCFCTVIDHNWRHSVWRTKSHALDCVSCVLFCSSHAMTSSVIYYSTDARKNEIYLLIWHFCIVDDKLISA